MQYTSTTLTIHGFCSNFLATSWRTSHVAQHLDTQVQDADSDASTQFQHHILQLSKQLGVDFKDFEGGFWSLILKFDSKRQETAEVSCPSPTNHHQS